MPSISVKTLPYYENKPSGLFNEYDTGGLRVYYQNLGEFSLPKKQRPQQKDRLVEIMLGFKVIPNVRRFKVLNFAKRVIYHDFDQILKKNCHYAIILRPSILFLSDLDFRIQFYAAMNLAEGFKDPKYARKLYNKETKYLFTNKIIKDHYTEEYMLHDPFNNSNGYWTKLNQTCRESFIQRRTLDSMMAKMLIFSAKNTLELNPSPKVYTNVYRSDVFDLDHHKISSKFTKIEQLSISLKILLEAFKDP